jgi:hypothetical protein
MSDWISVKDKLPPKRKWVLATNGKRVERCCYDWGLTDAWYIGTEAYNHGSVHNPDYSSIDRYLYNVTHWMELPELPNV